MRRGGKLSEIEVRRGKKKSNFSCSAKIEKRFRKDIGNWSSVVIQ